MHAQGVHDGGLNPGPDYAGDLDGDLVGELDVRDAI